MYTREPFKKNYKLYPIKYSIRDIFIGFCTKEFPREGKMLGDVENSYGIGVKSGIRIDGDLKKYSFGIFKEGDVVGVGIVHYPSKSLLKSFVTLNGQLLGNINLKFELNFHLLGKITLPAKFSNLKLFPAATMSVSGESIRANFGQEKWLFDLNQVSMKC